MKTFSPSRRSLLAFASLSLLGASPTTCSNDKKPSTPSKVSAATSGEANPQTGSGMVLNGVFHLGAACLKKDVKAEVFGTGVNLEQVIERSEAGLLKPLKQAGVQITNMETMFAKLADIILQITPAQKPTEAPQTEWLRAPQDKVSLALPADFYAGFKKNYLQAGDMKKIDAYIRVIGKIEGICGEQGQSGEVALLLWLAQQPQQEVQEEEPASANSSPQGAVGNSAEGNQNSGNI